MNDSYLGVCNNSQLNQLIFNELNEKRTNAETLGYFNLKTKTAIIAEASPTGLGAVLVQTQNGESRVVCYASRSLSDVCHKQKRKP